MKWFYNMKISVKLLAGFILVAVIAGCIGLVGVINIQTINKDDKQLYENITVPLEDLVTMAESFQRARSNLRDFIISQTDAERQDYQNRINLRNDEVNKSLADFKTKLLTKEGKDDLKAFEEARAKYDTYVSEVINLDKQNKDAEALALLRGDAEAAVKNAEAALDKVASQKIDLAASTSDGNQSAGRTAIIIVVSLIAAGVFLAIVLGIFISFSISRPVRKMVGIAGKMSRNDLDVSIDVNTKDEIGTLADAFRTMSDNLNQVISDISFASEQVSSGASQVSASGQVLSQGSTEQASSLEEITSSMTEVATQTKQNAVNASQANELAGLAKQNAVQGNSQMSEMLKSMQEINEASSNISKIIKVIDEIAFQTNILALNAAVEAARAGQHGKGFAVVAEEVRNLAARSANAAKETTEMIEGSIKKVETGTKIANETAVALDKIVDGVTKVANLVGDIAAASNEQATGIAQVNQAISQVSQVVQTNSATAEESAAASEELSGQAELLKETVKKFKLKTNKISSGSYDGLKPDVLRAIENLVKKNNLKNLPELSENSSEAAATSSNINISLEDTGFGKY